MKNRILFLILFALALVSCGSAKKYVYLNDFDNAMISLVSHVHNFQALPVRKLWEKDDD